MKFIAKGLFAFLITYLHWSLVQEFATTPTAIKLTHWVYKIPFMYEVVFFWALFTFPRAAGQIFTFIGNGLVQVLIFSGNALGQLVTQLSKYRAGQIALIALGLYLAYVLIF